MRTNEVDGCKQHCGTREKRRDDVTGVINIIKQRTVGEHFSGSPYLKDECLPRASQFPHPLCCSGMQHCISSGCGPSPAPNGHAHLLFPPGAGPNDPSLQVPRCRAHVAPGNAPQPANPGTTVLSSGPSPDPATASPSLSTSKVSQGCGRRTK